MGTPLFIQRGGAGFAPREEAASTDSVSTWERFEFHLEDRVRARSFLPRVSVR